jgi:hypothetical protein
MSDSVATLDYSAIPDTDGGLEPFNGSCNQYNQWILPTGSRPSDDASCGYVSLEWGDVFADYFAKLSNIQSEEALRPETAPAPNQTAVAIARAVLSLFYQLALTPKQVTATADGGVAICFVNGNKYSDIECSNDGVILGVTSNRRDRPVVWEIEQSDAGIYEACARVRKFIGGDSR